MQMAKSFIHRIPRWDPAVEMEYGSSPSLSVSVFLPLISAPSLRYLL